MWWFITSGSLGRCYRECQRSRGVFSYEHFATWGPSVPVAIMTGFICAYAWLRMRPCFTDDPDELRQVSEFQDFKEVRNFLNGIHDQMTDMWYATFGQFVKTRTHEFKQSSTPRSSAAETISKEGVDILLSKGRPMPGDVRTHSSETILGTMAFRRHIPKDSIINIREKLNALSGGEVHQVAEASYILQSRLQITHDLLTDAMDIAREGTALDPLCTLQLGSWGIMVNKGEKVELLKFQGGPVPVVLDATREAGYRSTFLNMDSTLNGRGNDELRVEGLFLEDVQMRAATAMKNVPLITKSLIKGGFAHDQGAGWMDVLFMEEPSRSDVSLEGSVVYATKNVDFEGTTLTLRSGFVPISSQPRPVNKSSDKTNVFLLGVVAVVIVLLPRSFWWPIFGKVVLPVLQLAAVSVGWLLGRYVLLGEWPLESKKEEMIMGNLRWSDHGPEPASSRSDIVCGTIRSCPTRYISAKVASIRQKMEVSNVKTQMMQSLKKQWSANKWDSASMEMTQHHELYWQKSLVELDHAVQLEPHNHLPLRIRGCIKGLTCDFQGAIVDLNSALERKHDHLVIPAYIERAVFKFLRGDCEGALADFDYAIHHGPEQPLEVIRLRNSIKRTLDERVEVARLREEVGNLEADITKLQSAPSKALTVEKAEMEDKVETVEKVETVGKVGPEVSSLEDTIKRFPQNQTMDLQYNSLCCERCISKIKGALLRMPDVESVAVDIYTSRVSVTGRVAPPKLLQISSKLSPNKVITLIRTEEDAETKDDFEAIPVALAF